MVRRAILIAVLVFTAGSVSSWALFAPLRVVGQRRVWDWNSQTLPLDAYYLSDEWNGERVCTRVLLHRQTGQMAAVNVPDTFCEPPH